METNAFENIIHPMKGHTGVMQYPKAKYFNTDYLFQDLFRQRKGKFIPVLCVHILRLSVKKWSHVLFSRKMGWKTNGENKNVEFSMCNVDWRGMDYRNICNKTSRFVSSFLYDSKLEKHVKQIRTYLVIMIMGKPSDEFTMIMLAKSEWKFYDSNNNNIKQTGRSSSWSVSMCR